MSVSMGHMIKLSGKDVATLLPIVKRGNSEIIVTSTSASTEVRAMNDMESIRVFLDGNLSDSGGDETVRVSPAIFSGISSTKTGVSISDTEIISGRKKVNLRKIVPSQRESLFNTIEGKDFPTKILLTGDEIRSISSGVSAVTKSTSSSSASCFMFTDGKITFANTDFFKVFLSKVGEVVEPSDIQDQKIMVTNTSVSALAALSAGENAEVMFSENLMAVKTGSVEMVTPLSSEQPKPYEMFQMEPSSTMVKNEIDVAGISEFVKAVTVLPHATSSTIDIEEDEVTFSAQDEDNSEITMSVTLEEPTENLDDSGVASVSVSTPFLSVVPQVFKGVVSSWVDKRTLAFSDGDKVVHIVKKASR